MSCGTAAAQSGWIVAVTPSCLNRRKSPGWTTWTCAIWCLIPRCLPTEATAFQVFTNRAITYGVEVNAETVIGGGLNGGPQGRGRQRAVAGAATAVFVGL